jgi:hypothetical protein
VSAARIAIGALAAAALGLAACHRATPDPTPHVDPEGRFTCCNLHYESDEVSDANYWVGNTIPPGTPVKIESVKPHSLTLLAGHTKLTLKHEYGTKSESFEQYIDKILVPYDPRRRIGEFPDEVQSAIAKSKVERGMTREQVIFSLGYPPAHHTPSLKELEWTYWYNRWITYKILFDERGKVTGVVGRPAPTAEVAIEHADPVPPEPQKKKGKKKVVGGPQKSQ